MTEDVRALLEHAESTAEGRGRSAVTTESVYAQVAGVRRRRRQVLAGAVAALIVAGAAAVPVMDRVRDDRPDIVAHGQSPGDAAGRARAKGLAVVLQRETGGIESVTRVSDAPVPTGHRPGTGVEIDWGDPSAGPLDGHYVITRRLGGKPVTTGLSVAYMSALTAKRGGFAGKAAACAAKGMGCDSTLRLGGSTLYTWQKTQLFSLGATPWRHFGNQRLLALPGGGALLVADGITKAPSHPFWISTAADEQELKWRRTDLPLTPLSGKQLTALALADELLPAEARPVAPRG
ncbi:hypothetical protein [Streptomyces qinzhouensis]|uniref:Uncharacterized protein n=1 Tax=Streptomyces qinzhouensis TaxID=2599401 RepID=A0A5B8JFB7_9ACTN|nr:hypothetical protein [Streptomyces qinzhouensis]QDY78974.1 hypothetical protein FQU76_23370 [Streptomyces qinzhouensis]